MLGCTHLVGYLPSAYNLAERGDMDRINEDGTQTTVKELLVGMYTCYLTGFDYEQMGKLYDMTPEDAKSYVLMGKEITEGKVQRIWSTK